ncbi:MAG: hypothetical protein ACFE7R_11155 [Candidatus Hodarchaeota archaeon]
MKKYGITIPSNPDEYSSGHSAKRALVLFTASIIICWVAMELVELAAITIPISGVVIIHALAFAVLVFVYRTLQLRAQRRK